MTQKIDYRPEIDGLRAVAVVAVLLYHLGVAPAGGGFVGVDVFFVVSGYLITKIIVSEMEASAFSFGGFYARRARRLLPALFAAIAVTFAAAAVLFAPEDLARTAEATIWAMPGLSNILFWRESGYFDVDGILKPLLHTWSLAVEIQFYLVWPAFIYLLARFGGRKAFLSGVVATIVAGTALSVWFLHIDPAAAFFLTPLRMHEFAIGALVACLPLRPSQAAASEAIFLVGIAAILAAMLLFAERMPFPGFAALLPALGTAFVIHASEHARSAFFLRSRPFVLVGLISYSLYLVHWPLIVIAHYLLQRVLEPGEQAMLFGLSVVLAVLSYRYIEKPFRGSGRKLARGRVFYPVWAVFAGITLLPAIHAWSSGGWLWRFPADLQAINSLDLQQQRDYVWDNFTLLNGKPDFSSDKPRVLVIGDSQAADLVNLLVAGGFERKAEIVTRAIFDECGLPSLSEFEAAKAADDAGSVFTKTPASAEACTVQYSALLSGNLIRDADFIIISKYWDSFALKGIDAFAASLKPRTAAHIEIASAKAFHYSSVQLVNNLGSIEGVEEYASTMIIPATVEANDLLRSRFAGQFIDLMASICPAKDFCYVLTSERKPIYWDQTHLTKDGAEFIARSFAGRIFPFLM